MNITKKAQQVLTGSFSLEDALPTTMPSYVNSVAYLWGATIICSLVILFISGPLLALFGPDWYHFSSIGRFVNSVHFWGTQVFFASMLLHLVTKFFMGAWRDNRRLTWMLGVLTFLVAIPTALTGILSQTNWDSQWVAVQAKDALNAVGVGSFFNTMNTGQMLLVHVAVLPAIILVLGLAHVVFVRKEGPVKPYDSQTA
jgi:quinol-cytochrome oxidoreductase complex cytochrome b subunit